MVGVFNGVVMMMVDLCCVMIFYMFMDWMVVLFYGVGIKFSGVVCIFKDFIKDIDGCDIFIVEDIIDIGLMLSYLVQNLCSCNLNLIEIMVMFCKFEVVICLLDVKYVGFDILNEFVVGYGFDYVDKYCNFMDVVMLVLYVYKF